MASKKNLDEPMVYYIPENFIATGTVGGGTFKVRNVVEAILIMLVLGYPIAKIPMPLTAKIVAIAIVCLPLAVLALVGVNNGPLSEYLLDVFKYKRIVHEYSYKQKDKKIIEGRGEKNEKK